MRLFCPCFLRGGCLSDDLVCPTVPGSSHGACDADAPVCMQAIDVAAVKEFAQSLLASKPSGVLVGDQAVMPKFDQVSRRFSP